MQLGASNSRYSYVFNTDGGFLPRSSRQDLKLALLTPGRSHEAVFVVALHVLPISVAEALVARDLVLVETHGRKVYHDSHTEECKARNLRVCACLSARH